MSAYFKELLIYNYKLDPTLEIHISFFERKKWKVTNDSKLVSCNALISKKKHSGYSLTKYSKSCCIMLFYIFVSKYRRVLVCQNYFPAWLYVKMRCQLSSENDPVAKTSKHVWELKWMNPNIRVEMFRVQIDCEKITYYFASLKPLKGISFLPSVTPPFAKFPNAFEETTTAGIQVPFFEASSNTATTVPGSWKA